MSSLPPTSSQYPISATNIFVCLHFYMITFSSTTTSVSLPELNKEWHIIDNHLVQVRQVELRPVAPNPRSGCIQNFARNIPRISTVISTATGIKLSVTPVWFEETKVTNPIRYPPTITAASNTELRRPFDILAKYRTVRDGQHTKNIDFVTEPFTSSVNSTETLIVVLDMLAQSNGMETSFTSKAFKSEDSIYRAACGVVNLFTMPLLSVDGGGPLLTATFNLKLNLSYEDISSSEDNTSEFVISFINDIAKKFECPPEYVRVFELARGSVMTKWGFTTPDQKYTQDLAKKFVQEAQKPFSIDLLVLSKTVPANYPIEWKQAPTTLQLQPSDFEPKYDRDYGNWPLDDSVQRRGARPYYRPVGWYRHALHVLDKYTDKRWLGMNNSAEEWPVAYHGTKREAVSPIMKDRLIAAKSDAYKKEVVSEKGPEAEDGIYLATHCNKGADANRYAESFTVKMPPGTVSEEETYKVVFQCRYNPKTFTEHGWTWKREPFDPLAKEIRVYKMDGVRPYGILLKKVKQNNATDLTGMWICDDNERNVQDAGKYFVSQFGEKVYWFGRQYKAPWNFANVSYGTINRQDSKLTIQWGDLPLGCNRLFGKLILEISSDYQNMVKANGSDKIFGGTHFRRLPNESLDKFEIDAHMKWGTTSNDMSGCWAGNDGTKYAIGVCKNQIYWLGIDETNRRSHVGVGTISGNIITINWGDIMTAQEKFHGEIECRIESPQRIIIVKCICGPFFTKELTKINLS
ncbi:unnamed protein product [Rotaria magnacalcarata]|uniref:Uncharacterized protein n=3 Tax=Rotaria magnacalcarata TaxID=392030 RepID=A0A816Z0J1_9BILA|nr:unnamed protein product [Rotaria magnacalcarata]CAF2187668.1 unnamed protein product [Rotaria magnacalcarata]CAF3806405.1 unnamed protein product [Rotaria magnacalcarata]